jgi:flagellar basal body-associated protein FliL
MADEEAQNQEQNAEATEAVEAGAEAVEEAPVEEPKAPSVLVPMLLSTIITVAGVGVMVAVILPKQISKAIAAASDTNGTHGHGQEDGNSTQGGGGDSKGGDDDSKGGGEETADPNAEADDPKKPVSIVPEGESIVVNPANSGGSRYLLVEIFLLREDEKDTGFTKAVESKTKQLQAVTADYLTAEDVQSLSNPATKDRLKAQLKLAYERQLGNAHPIKELIVSKWIMQ